MAQAGRRRPRERAARSTPSIGDSPVALIDARHIVEAVEARRQDPPPAGPPTGGVYRPRDGQEAACLATAGCLRVIAVSHPWQQPDHPDPEEVNLTHARQGMLERFIEDGQRYGDGDKGHNCACFFDFMPGCFQKGPDGKRTAKETALFG